MGSQNTSSKPVNQNKKNDKPPQNNKEDDTDAKFIEKYFLERGDSKIHLRDNT